MMIDIPLLGNETAKDFFLVIVIFIIVILLSKIISFRIRKTFTGKISKDRLESLIKLIYAIAILIVFVTVLPIFGINISGFILFGGVIGIAIGFASQSVISNFISGLFLISERPIKIGDFVSVNEEIGGMVADIKIMSTTIVKWDGVFVRVPNEKLLTSYIMNFSSNPARRFEFTIGIRYSDDADRAIEIIKELIEKHPYALVNPPSQVFVDNLGDNGVNIIVRIWAASSYWFPVKMEILPQIKKTLEENGIEIPFPQRTLWFANALYSQKMS